jgi:hypothetical protein
LLGQGKKLLRVVKSIFSHSPQASAWGQRNEWAINRFNGFPFAMISEHSALEKPLKRLVKSPLTPS